jgi:hypothetical protein
VEAQRPAKSNRIQRHPDDVYVREAQILAHMGGGDTVMEQDPEPGMENNQDVEQDSIQVVDPDEGSLSILVT